ncbi:carbohydrate ABC transporter permease [Mesobacillus foraminis]|uniref:Multiple sugar transport system permease protein n=1 Tax=Mesobacillus foraminis TaxID=279826 RepID=A0A4V2RCI7_9BACI|nr:sugar ABC transporter permease [Mesobacillus foraminis]TCN21140.1 multiple sugar transport system permease protein [Mesobacillus foraminis]
MEPVSIVNENKKQQKKRKANKVIGLLSNKKKLSLNLFAWLFLSPYLLFYSWFMLYPIVKGFIISLYEWSIGNERTFVGFGNYKSIFQDSFFWEALSNTVYFVVISTPTLVITGILLALIVNAKLKGTGFLRSAFFLPHILSISVISSIWVFVLQPYTGLMNAVLKSIGITTEIFWLDSENLAWLSILLATIWWTVGFNMVLFLAGLQEIPDDYYEAARIDGANSWHCFRFITLPLLKGVILLVVVLQSIASFKLFGQSYLMTNGGPGTSTRTLVQYIYETGFRSNEMGVASAMSYVLFLVMILFAIVQFKFMSKKD